MINNKSEYIKMDSVENSHWWYKSLHHMVLNIIKNEFNSSNISILDAGCGTGGLLSSLTANGYNFLHGFDISKEAIDIAKSKNLKVSISDLKQYKYTDQAYDIIISNDTMYFLTLDEQKKILNEFYKSLNLNGIVILNLPSFDTFRGMHDEAVGIKKRFNKKMVHAMIKNSKYKVIKQTYWPFSLSPIIFFIRMLQRFKLIFLKNSKIKSDIDLPSDVINNILYKVVSFENKFLVKKPFGSSLFLVLQKK
ncbi:MAG: class I SAM-dependent methyltransferase [Sulfuricurvum sp.]|nr:class I SAM-dependent methyltransferase [Sulfuricurvum sp.]